ncbi:MAG: GGDEF domain-containing protein [Halothiobacillaceae bacterium]
MNRPEEVCPEALLASVVRMTEQRSRETLEESVVQALDRVVGARQVLILAPHPSAVGGFVSVVASARPRSDECNDEALGALALVRECLLSSEETCGHGPGGMHSCCVPLTIEDQVAALVLVLATHPLEVQLPMIRGICDVYRNYLHVLHDAERDTLTGLRNRKTFDANLGRVIDAARPDAPPHCPERRQDTEAAPHWLAICDIDHFKRINDTWGHVYGDEILLLFATLMRQVFRSGDQLFRFGGEEFVVVLAPTPSVHVEAVLERFRRTVEQHDFPQVGRVTVSIGYARIRSDDVHSELLGRADTALYWAKDHGRNRICSYEALARENLVPQPKARNEVELF